METNLEWYKVLSARELADKFDCSTRTIFRKLEESGYLTSYNMNGEMLTLPRTPDFDKNGLWEYKGARFSVWRNLGPTVHALVDESDRGLTASELGDLLSHPDVHHHLLACVRKGQLVRARSKGRSVYYSADPDRRQEQEAARHHERPMLPPPDLTTIELVWLLRAVIRCNHIPYTEVVAALETDRRMVSASTIRWLVEGCSGDGTAPTSSV